MISWNMRIFSVITLISLWTPERSNTQPLHHIYIYIYIHNKYIYIIRHFVSVPEKLQKAQTNQKTNTLDQLTRPISHDNI